MISFPCIHDIKFSPVFKISAKFRRNFAKFADFGPGNNNLNIFKNIFKNSLKIIFGRNFTKFADFGYVRNFLSNEIENPDLATVLSCLWITRPSLRGARSFPFSLHGHGGVSFPPIYSSRARATRRPFHFSLYLELSITTSK